MRRFRVFSCLAILLLAVAAARPGVASDGAYALPTMLSAADVDRYREIFRVQESGQWNGADRIIGTLESDLLMGHVLFQRYMHPTAYRSRYSELRDWLALYADHPDADRIYKLAQKRRPRGVAAPRAPVGAPNYAVGRASSVAIPTRSLSRKQRNRKRQILRAIAKHIGQGWPSKSLEILERGESQSLLSPEEVADARADIAFGYYAAGVDDKALTQAELAASAAPDHVGIAHWMAGLAAWRMGDYALATTHFEALAQSPGVSSWNMAAGGYWAARGHLIDGRPDQVSIWLESAAVHSHSFYGQLAQRALGFVPAFDWSLPAVTAAHEQALLASGPGSRGLALVQVGRLELAEQEFLRVDARDNVDLAEMLLRIADGADLPGLSLRIGTYLEYKTGRDYDVATYPLPHWEPPQGYYVDRALIFAFMRQESRFDPDAMSHAGARGLMQLMPGTASYISGDRSLRGRSGRNRLFDPELNIDLGQQYVQHLLGLSDIDNDLFRLATAYNGGPGNLAKWQDETAYHNDPLLFIESIPSRETRIFIERVMTNLWIYRQRLGQPAPSLDRIAAGGWPTYARLGNGNKVIAELQYD